MKLLFNAVFKFILGVLLVGLLIFIPAGTLDYYNGWLFVLLMFIPMLILGVVLFIASPQLLRERIDGKEKEKTQKGIIAFSGVAIFGGFVIAGIDFRFGWSQVPVWVTIIASCVFLLSYALYCEVMRENVYLSRTIKIQSNQKVIDCGLYGIVRHPMYSVTIFLFLMIPLILGSLYSFIIFLHYPIIIVVRIKNEEKILEEGLAGYKEYKKRVKYRLIPFIW